MTRLYKSVARLTAFRLQPDSFFAVETNTNGVEIENLRLQFTVERKLAKQPDTCTVVITNASEDTRSYLQEHPLKLILEAGYDGEYRQLFSGDMRWGSSVRRGTDWETTLQIADGGLFFKHARVSRSFGAGVTVRDAVAECARAAGFLVPRELQIAPELGEQFAAGLTLDGLAHDELTRLLAPYGYEWTVQDGQFRAYRDDQAREDEALLIDEDNAGMVDVPEFAPPTQSAKKSKSVKRSTLRSPRLTVKTLLYPQVMPGSRLKIDSETTRGIYKAIQVSHVGDTGGPDFLTTIEAKPHA